MLCLVTQSCLTLCDLMDCSLPGSYVLSDSPGKNTGVVCQAFLQGIFPTQGLNPGLPHCRRILYLLSHLGEIIGRFHIFTSACIFQNFYHVYILISWFKFFFLHTSKKSHWWALSVDEEKKKYVSYFGSNK